MEKVYVYKSGDGYRVFPPVVILNGGEKLRVINTTNVEMKATFPAGSVDASDPVKKDVPKQGKAEVDVRSQGNGKARGYEYTIQTARGVRARGNSDPVLIIEN